MQSNGGSFWTRPYASVIVAAAAALAIIVIGAAAALLIISQPASPTAVVAERPTVIKTVEKIIIITATPVPTEPPTPSPLPTATPTPTPTPTPQPTPTPTPTPTPLPPPKWSALSDLSVIEYTASTVIERSRSRGGIGDILLGTDRVVLMALGRVRVGVDLSKIKPTHVQINGRRIKLKIPRAQVLAVELLPEASRVFDSQRSWLFSEYEGLELEALDEARRKLWTEAERNAEMLEIAETMARLQLTEFLRKAGFEQVEIEFE
ncbi:MAG: DUF4230 domain-containing protein [Thermoflexales bacterium]|nr:DUF4230 domain-containing protein [Thermoflexales bacterium]MDW8352590.1 DUF4230 domain-containing protein [Anaerolineae bacterium]